jgi:hypothetical protein
MSLLLHFGSDDLSKRLGGGLFAIQHFVINDGDVRFGSQADIDRARHHVRFGPEADLNAVSYLP